MNYIQYATWSCFDKVDYKKRTTEAWSGTTDVCCIENPTLDLLKSILETGHLVMRAGDTTSLVWVDYDNKDESKITIDMARKALSSYSDIAVVGSSSGDPCKFHILREIEPIPMTNLKDECSKLKELVCSIIPEISEFDPRCDMPYQLLYGQPSYSRTSHIFPGSFHIRKLIQFKGMYTEDPHLYRYEPNPYETTTMPLSSATLSRILKVSTLDENGFRWEIKMLGKWNNNTGKWIPKKLKTGERYNAFKKYPVIFALRWKHLNENCNYPVSRSCAINTFEMFMLNSVYDPDDWKKSKEFKGLIDSLKEYIDKIQYMEFQEAVGVIGKSYTQPKRAFKTNRFKDEAIQLFLNTAKVSGKLLPNNSTLQYTVPQLHDIAIACGVHYNTLTRTLKQLGYSWISQRTHTMGMTSISSKTNTDEIEKLATHTTHTPHILMQLCEFGGKGGENSEILQKSQKMTKKLGAKKGNVATYKLTTQKGNVFVTKNDTKTCNSGKDSRELRVEKRAYSIHLKLKKGTPLTGAERKFKCLHKDLFQ